MVNYWQISPGRERDNLWPEFLEKGIIAIGFEKPEDLSRYDSEDLLQKGESQLGTNDLKSLWLFSHKIEENDVIVAKKGSSREIYGIGKVLRRDNGKIYYFDTKREYYKHIIQVKWIIDFSPKRFETQNLEKEFVQMTVYILPENRFRTIKGDILAKFPEYNGKFNELMELNVNTKNTLEDDPYNRILSLLNQKKQIILYGPPGTGKTYKTRNYVEELIELDYTSAVKKGRSDFITFHPSYSYEEFVEGITVNTETDSTGKEEIQYIQKCGIFKKICTKALASALHYPLTDRLENNNQWIKVFNEYQRRLKKNPEQRDGIWRNALPFVLVIDEINRGDISKIFGELITLIEEDKRLGRDNEIIVELPYSNDKFAVPQNVYLIGTMNTADRSISLLDIALRRRFGFVPMDPDFEILKNEHLKKNEAALKTNGVYEVFEKSIEAIKAINEKIIEDLGRDKRVGHSFFFKVYSLNDLILVWQSEVLPLLEEYYYSDYQKILKLLGLPKDYKFFNAREGIKGFKNIDELTAFLDQLTKKE